MSLAELKITKIDVNLHLQKSLEIFDENSADKIWSKKDKEIKASPLMPMRVKGPVGLVCFECPQPVKLESFIILFTIRKFVVFFYKHHCKV